MLKSYVAFDIETTGLNPEHNEIIEIGALKVREGKVVDRFIRFIEPEAGIPPMITQLTGITNDMVEGVGNCGEVLPEFLEFCEQDTLVADVSSSLRSAAAVPCQEPPLQRRRPSCS